MGLTFILRTSPVNIPGKMKGIHSTFHTHCLVLCAADGPSAEANAVAVLIAFRVH